MKLSIVGGCITGCMALVLRALDGLEVTPHEASSRIEGVLRDIEVAEKLYFNACQYLHKVVWGQLDWSNIFTEFSHEYGSITVLGNTTKLLVDDCAQPILDGEVIYD